ncbi:hypothetical protein PS1_007609 [Malus domestica]
MVSSISILDSLLCMAANLLPLAPLPWKAVFASLESYIASLPSLINAAIEEAINKAFATKLPAYFEKFRRELQSQGAGEGISAPLSVEHHLSREIKPLQLPPSPVGSGAVQSQRIPSTIQANSVPPLLSS